MLLFSVPFFSSASALERQWRICSKVLLFVVGFLVQPWKMYGEKIQNKEIKISMSGCKIILINLIFKFF